MRTLILAFGLLILPAVVMAAPSNPCSVKVIKNAPVLKGCSAKERKQFATASDAASSKPTTKAIDRLLRKRQGKFYLSIRSVCYGYKTATRKSVSEKAISRCADRLGYSPRIVVLQAENNINAIEKCTGIKSYRRQVDCMIESKNNQEIEDIIYAALDLQRAYINGLKTLKKFGCKLKNGKLQCAGLDSWHALAFLILLALGRKFPRTRVLCGVVAMVVGAVYANTADATCTNVKLLPALTKLSSGVNLSGKTVEALKELNIVVQEGSCGGLVIVLLYGLLGLLGECRSKLLIVLVALGSMTSLADAACTDAEVTGNEVAAQYGMVLYNCDKDKVSQASKDAVYNVIYRGYVAQKGRLSKEYIRGRWARVESAFWSVWKGAPLWQAQIAAAICSKEFLCGVQVKYSEWESKYWVGNRTNNNGTTDCGITQINSANTAFSCDELQDFHTAFQEQRRIIILKVRNSSSKAVWKKNIHRYNHSRNYQYGKTIWQWSGASFGWSCTWIFLCGLFRRRRREGKGQDVVGTETLGDWQKRNYPTPSLNSWVSSALDQLKGEEVAGYESNSGQVVEIQKGEFQLDCTVSTISMRDVHTGEICNRFTIVKNEKGRWIRHGFSGYFEKE